ncbi:MAG: phosphoribosyltransferase [Gemmatimonadaceae bacterium]|nr:phosphoribosyltransferase [Gemmatimonadaceae bacterium]
MRLTPGGRRCADVSSIDLGRHRLRPFADRHEAGRLLARQLPGFSRRDDAIVLALPRGGVPVAAEVSAALGLPLDVFVVRKIGAPGDEELALGAIASGGITRLDPEMLAMAGVTPGQLDEVISRERAELLRREQAYRGDRPEPDLEGWTVILVDDGLATGSTMLAAIQAVRTRHPAKIVVAVPVASREALARIRQEHVECHALATPELLFAVGAWYHDFTPTTDEEVQHLLSAAGNGRIPDSAPGQGAR